MLDAFEKAKLKNKYQSEQVYVVPSMSLKDVADKFQPGVAKTNFRNGKFVFRYDAEYNNALQQIIPYILVLNHDKTKVYVTKRIAGEERLKDSLALGCGGHINPCDAAGDIIIAAAYREMNEELTIQKDDDSEFKTVGTVRDLASATNEHLGIVLTIVVEDASVKETENLEGIWMTKEELYINYEKFESWARHIIDYLFLQKSDSFFEGSK